MDCSFKWKKLYFIFLWCYNWIASYIECYKVTRLVNYSKLYCKVSVIKHVQFTSITCNQILSILIKCKWLDCLTAMLNICINIWLVHGINTANVLIYPRNSHMISFVTEWYLFYRCIWASFSTNRSIKLCSYFLSSDIIHDQLSVCKTNTDH